MKTPVLFLLSVFLLAACTNTEETVTDAEGPPLIIETVRVAAKTIQPEYSTFGILAASKTAQVSSFEEGRVESINVEIGDAVRAGAVLARTDASALRNQLKEIEAKSDYALAQIEIAEAALKEAEDEVERRMIEKEMLEIELIQSEMEMARTAEILEKKKALFEAEGISAESLAAFSAAAEKAMSEFKKTGLMLKMKSLGITPEALRKNGISVPTLPSKRLSLYKENLTGMERGRIAEAKAKYREVEALRQTILKKLDESIIRSPITGRVAKVGIEIGELVTRGNILFSVIDTTILDIEARVPVKELEHIHLHQEVLIRLDKDPDGKDPDGKKSGRVRYITPFLDPTSRSATVRCTLGEGPLKENPEGKGGPLTPGDFVDLTFPYGEKEEYILVPRNSVLEQENEKKHREVYQVRSGRLFPHPIYPKFQWKKYYAISEGLEEGALLWKHPISRVPSGTKVEIAP